ncbi:MAG: hypothetical protein ACJA0Q_001340 [Saprospiraceae bacterium]|jgi:hypothetical protein
MVFCLGLITHNTKQMKKIIKVLTVLLTMTMSLQAQFGGLPEWPLVTASPNYLEPTITGYTPHEVVDWATGTNVNAIPNTTPTLGRDNWAPTQAGYDDCGNLAFYVLHSGVTTESNALEIYRPDGTLLLGKSTTPAAPNGNRSDDEMQIVKRPGFSNQWFLIYGKQNGDGYNCVEVLYSLVEINGTAATYVTLSTIVQKDISLTAPAVGGCIGDPESSRLYIHAKAASRTSKTIAGNGHDLYLHRRYDDITPKRVGNSTFSIDRFEISQQGISWSANSGSVSSYGWGLLAAGSPLELSPLENKLAVMARTQSANLQTIYVFDLTTTVSSVTWSTGANWNNLNWGVGTDRYTVGSTVNHSGSEYQLLSIPSFNVSPTDPIWGASFWTVVGSCNVGLNNTPDVIKIADLLVEPDVTNSTTTGYNATPGILSTYSSARSLGLGTSYLRFLRNYDRKISHCEFSWDGNSLYTTCGGYQNAGHGNLTYLSQIDLKNSHNGVHPVRIQIETVLNASGTDDWNPTTGLQIPSWSGVSSNGTTNSTLITHFLNYHGLYSVQSCVNGNFYFTKQHQNQLFVIPTPNASLSVNLIPGQIDLSTTADPNITLQGFPLYTPDQIDGFNYLRADFITVDIPVQYQESSTGCTFTCGTLGFSVVDQAGVTISSFEMNECPDVFSPCLSVTESYNLVGANGVVFNNAIVNGNLNFPAGSNGVFDFTTDVANPEACCPTLNGVDVDHLTLYSVNTTISSDLTWDHKIYIDDNVTVTIDNGAILDITTVDVIFGECAKLLFTDGAIIRATNSVFRPCDMFGTWAGVEFDQSGVPASGIVNECTFKNAGNAIRIFNNGVITSTNVRLTNNLFSNCATGVSMSRIILERGITGNTFQVDEDAPQASPCYNPSARTGINVSNTTISSVISQNNFINNFENVNFRGISLSFCNEGSISNNHFTNNSTAISSGYCSSLDIENNDFETNRYTDRVYAQISTGFLNTSRIINNRFYNSATNNKSSVSSVRAISLYMCSVVNIKLNSITNFETGIQTREAVNSNISENDIRDCWYYGIYNDNPKNVDVSCNVINMEPFGGRNTMGIATFFDTYTDFPGSIRNNCIFETNTAIHIENKISSSTSVSPEIINNYLYNYSEFGVTLLQVDASSAFGTALTQQDASKNTFHSNNIPNGAVDIIAGPSVSTTVYGSFGLSTLSGLITPVGTGLFNSTASCGSQIGTVFSGILDDEICDRLEGHEANFPPVIYRQSSSEDYNFDKLSPSEIEAPKVSDISSSYASVTPNPATDEVTIEVNSAEGDEVTVTFYSTHGEMVKQLRLVGKNASQKISVADFAPGMYIISVTDNTSTINQLKLIKK